MELPTNTSGSYLNGTLYTYPELIFFSVGFSILIVLAISGNSLVLVAVARTKKLQNVTNVFVVNLSLTDCLYSFGFLWSVIGMASTTPGYPLESDIPCVAAAGLLFIAVGSSVNTLANIALNRCILITRPKETYQWLYTPKKIALMVLVSWLMPFCAIVPPLSGLGDLGFDPESRTCSDVDTHPRAAAYDKVQFAIIYPAPLLVIIVSYILIWRHIKQHFRNRRNNTINLQSTPKPLESGSNSPKPDATDTNASSSQKPGELSPRHRGNSHHLSRMRNEQLAITKNLFVVVLAFVVCFSPLCLMVVTKNNRYHLYGALFLFMSGCINPLIYAAKHPHFRPVLRSMVRCRCSTEEGG